MPSSRDKTVAAAGQETGERGATSQLRALSRVQESSGITAQQMSAAAGTIHRNLDTIAPLPKLSTWAPAFMTPTAARDVKPYKPRKRIWYVCPNCSCGDLRPCEREAFHEELLRLIFIKPVRCQKCLRRYLRF